MNSEVDGKGEGSLHGTELLLQRNLNRTTLLSTYSNVPLDSSVAGVTLESFPDLEFQQARIHKVGNTESTLRSRPASCLGRQEGAHTETKAFRDSVSLFPPHDPCWLHFVNHLIQMTPKYPCRVELGVSFSEDR